MRAPRASIAKKAISHASQPVLISSIVGTMLIRMRMAKIASKVLNNATVFLLIFLIVFIRQLKKVPTIRLDIAAKISTTNHPETCKRQSINN